MGSDVEPNLEFNLEEEEPKQLLDSWSESEDETSSVSSFESTEEHNETVEFEQENVREIEAEVFPLDLVAPPMMIKNSSCCSVDSVLSEDTLNLLNFNKGFGGFVEVI